jgi:O-antigen ligase
VALATALTLAVAGLTFLLGFNDGTYQLTDRSAVAIAAWWAIAIGIALAVWPRSRPPLAALVAAGALAAFAVLTLLSVSWAASDEKAFAEFTRVLLYLGVLVLVALAVTRRTSASVADGIAAGIVAVVLIALASRLFWGDVGPGAPPSFFPVRSRLHYPVNYWNGLAILAGLAFPLLLRAAVARRPGWLRALALVPVPAMAAAIYLTSSRGGYATAAVGVLVFCALTDRRLSAVVATAIAGAGAALAVEGMLARDALVNGPLGSAQASSEGESAAILMLLLGSSCALVYWAWCRVADWEPRVRLPLAAKAGLALVAVAAVAVAVQAYDPVDKFETFKKPSGPDVGLVEGDFTRSHLLSSTGSGRWQLWTAAVDEWETRPLLGRGAGSYQSWWSEHASLSLFVRDAHSLWLETLGELGLVGLLLLGTAFGAAFVAALTRRRRPGADRPLIAAMAAVLAAFCVAAAIDWMWELSIVGLVAIVALAMLVGRATAPEGDARPAPAPADRAHARLRARVLRTAGVAVAFGAILCVAVPMLSQSRLEESQAAAARADAQAAIDAADEARAIQPWAATPHLQLALLEEQEGNLAEANRHIDEALERDDSDWSIWLVAARLQTKAGVIGEGRRSLRQAERLNRRSQVFEALRDRSKSSRNSE